MGQAGFDAAKEIGIDLSAHAISVEESAQAIKKMVGDKILRARERQNKLMRTDAVLNRLTALLLRIRMESSLDQTAQNYLGRRSMSLWRELVDL